MTTPNIPSDDGFPVAGGLGSILGNLTGGNSGNVGGGTLGGTNNLQQSLDTLNRSVSNLTNTLGSLNWGGGQQSGNAQQQPNQGFPNMVNPFRNNTYAPGIGGGGPGGAGNVSTPTPFGQGTGGNGGYQAQQYTGFGALVAAGTGFGTQQMPIQLALNAYAANTRLGLPTGTSFPAAQGIAFNQAIGYGNNNLNALAINPQDAIGMAQALQYAGGSPNYMSTAIGRGAYGATAAFGITNPLLSGSSAAGLAQQIYNPTLSLKMLSLGYSSQPRVLGGGANNSATFAQSLFRAWNGGKSNINPSTLNASLAQGGKANLNLQALGLNPQQMQPFLQGYNQLFRQGYSTTQAQSLFNAAAQNKPGAQQTLNNLGVSTTDIQKIKNNQSTLAGRDATYATAFNSALSAATTGLQDFNRVLTTIMQHTGLSSVAGGAGGLLGTLSGTNGLNSLLGLGGAFSLGSRLFGGGSGASAGGGLLSRLGGGAGGAEAGGVAALGVPALAIAGGAAGAFGINKLAGMKGTPGGIGQLLQTIFTATSGNPKMSFNTDNWLLDANNWATNVGGSISRMFGGATAAPAASSKQSGNTSKSNPVGGGNGASVAAVSAAESQLGVPYLWGGEQPGVGFDCSGLVQWAYKQAGVNLPRTSQAQWSELQRRSIALNQVREGDLVFQAGSDGTANAPGHVGMMVSSHELIQAPFTGADVQLIGYDPRGWQHAARPSGAGGGGFSTTGPGTASTLPGLAGNSGLGIGGSYGSTEEIDAINGALGAGGGFYGAPQQGFGAAGSGSGSKSNSNGGTTGNLSGNKKIMNQIASRFGWGTGQEWNSLNNLEMHEAGYNNLAQNPTSTAYGMGQFLDTTWATVGGHKTSNATLQAEYMMKYIKQRYGNPEKAWAQYFQHPGGVGWYGTGTNNLLGNISVVGDRGPELMIGGSGSQILNNAQTMQLLKSATAQPAQSPWSVLNNLGLDNATNQQQQQMPCPTININIGKDAVVVRVDNASSDALSAGRAIAKSIVQSISDEQILKDIMSGNKNGQR